MADRDWIEDNVELYAIDGLPAAEHAEMEASLAALSDLERQIYQRHIVDTQSAMTDYAGRYAAAPPADLRGRILDDHATGTRQVIPIRSRRRRIATIIAAAAVVIAVALAAGVGIGRVTAPSTKSSVAQSDPTLAVLAAPDATMQTTPLDDGRGTLALVVSRSHDQAVAIVRRTTNPVPADRSLQFWLVGKAPTPISAGLVDNAAAPPLLINAIGGAQVLAVTLEPRGGSPAPTTPLLTKVPL
ncbi:anti-sigma factor [Jongsikchunia kroppenstedtii]|uniref:anti-sigma factor n=1 Tax=Jongsikchunia kroppenstedtii TaxID=1121721 RepID=UPI000380CB0E|nr:anti-sigma factor [Jongsikchunia kroppenstedtii]